MKQTSSSAINFIINRPPSNGSCSITPLNGTTTTLFTVFCSNWSDQDGIKDYSIYSLFYFLCYLNITLLLIALFSMVEWSFWTSVDRILICTDLVCSITCRTRSIIYCATDGLDSWFDVEHSTRKSQHCHCSTRFESPRSVDQQHWLDECLVNCESKPCRTDFHLCYTTIESDKLSNDQWNSFKWVSSIIRYEDDL